MTSIMGACTVFMCVSAHSSPRALTVVRSILCLEVPEDAEGIFGEKCVLPTLCSCT